MYIPYGGNEKEEAARYRAAWKTYMQCGGNKKQPDIRRNRKRVYSLACRLGSGAENGAGK
ncbi:MAG: hypothetical protein HFH32_06190 [Eubacterium sp.]|nr:hypothetical protein [Eubacterium sp.]